MNAYETAQAWNITGTDAGVVAALKATGVTVRKIDLAYLMELLNFRGMLRKTDGAAGSERWVGTLQNLKSALIAMNQTDAVTAYETWFSHVTNPRQSYWDTTIPAYAAGFRAMKMSFADQPTMPSLADFEAVEALGGGSKFETLDESEYSAQRQQAEDDAAAARAAEEAANAAAALAELIANKQAALAESNDACIRVIRDTEDVTQEAVLAAFTTRLAETWPVEV
jgi:hypothetical protein